MQGVMELILQWIAVLMLIFLYINTINIIKKIIANEKEEVINNRIILSIIYILIFFVCLYDIV